MISQRTELIAGLLSGVLGVAGLTFVLFGPVYPYTGYTNSGVVNGSEGLLVDPHGFVLLPPPANLLIPITLSLVLPLLVLVGAVIHSRQQSSLVGLFLLLGGTSALLIETIFNPVQLLQLFLLPSLFLALVACVLAMRTRNHASLIAAEEARG